MGDTPPVINETVNTSLGFSVDILLTGVTPVCQGSIRRLVRKIQC